MSRSVACSVAGLVVAGALITSPALADGGYPIYGGLKDEPLYAPPPIVWSGIYIGLHAGYGWGEADWRFKNWTSFNHAAGERFDHDPEGGIVGGHVGFNRQTDRFVWGLEATLSGADISETSESPFWAGDRLTTEIDVLWTATARLGYDWGRVLTYVKGGYAGASVEVSARDPLLAITAQEDKTHHGWTVGAGLEYLVSPDLVLGVEYGYFDLGEAGHRGHDSVDVPFRVDSDVTLHTVMARLSYKFRHDRDAPLVPLLPLK